MMSDKLLRLVRILLWVLMGVSVLVAILFVYQLMGADGREAEMAASEPMIYWTYLLIAIAAIAAVTFPLVYILRNPRKALKALLSVAALGIVVLVAYLLSDGTAIQTATSGTNPDFADAAILKFSDTGIFTTYILFGVSILLLLITGVRGIFKNM